MFILFAFLSVSFINAQIPAFPGAEGYGSTTTHGRGGQVIEVTNLNDSGSGSLREAVNTSGARIIVFRVGGLIELESTLTISDPYCYIAGQTAPGDGICLSRVQLAIRTHDVVVRYIRSRPGDDDPGYKDPENRDGFEIANSSGGVYNIILDHCSVSWAIDENISTWYECHDITIQWCIIAEGLNRSLHPKGAHGMGLLVGNESNCISVHHNLFAHNNSRNPLLKAGTYVDIVNNVVYNWGQRAMYLSDYEETGDPIFANLVCNYFKKGLSKWEVLIPGWAKVSTSSKLYLQGNIGPNRPNDTYDEWALVHVEEGNKDIYRTDTRFSAPPVTNWDAVDVFDKVLNNAGASLPVSDSVDVRIVQDVIDNTGSIIDAVSETPGYPSYNSGTPATDSDHDGMPDSFELDNTSPPSATALNSSDTGPSGYTWIEEYVNGLVPCFTCDSTYTSTGNTTEAGSVNTRYKLDQNFPNPFNPITRIRYDVKRACHIKMVIYDIMGSLIAVLVDGVKPAGTYSIEWEPVDSNGRQLSGGIYICRIQADSYVENIKLILMR